MPISLEEYEARIGRPARVTSAASTSQREYGWGDRLGASVDRFQGQVQGTMEELGFDTGDARRQNEANSRFARQRAIEETGAPQSFGETFESPTKFARGVGGLFVDSAPELALSLGTGLVGGLAGVGTMGRLGMAAAANYPAAVGDILGNQRDEAGRTDAGSAFALGVPYVAADMLGLDAALASGRMTRTGIKSLDDMQGFKGGLYRTGANVLMNAPIEGGNEAFQEGLNQAGRMEVNPEQTLFNEESNDRYLESFGSGALMGGAASAALGGWRRTPGYEDTRVLPADRTVDDGAPVSLLGGERPAFGLTSYGADEGPAPLGTPVESADNLQSDLGEIAAQLEVAQEAGNAEEVELLTLAYRDTYQRLLAQRPITAGEGQVGLMSGVNEMVSGQAVELTTDELRQGMMPFVPPDPFDQKDAFDLAPRGSQAQQGLDFTYTEGLPSRGAAPPQVQPGQPAQGAVNPEVDLDADLKEILALAGVKPNKKGGYPARPMAAARDIASADLDDDARTAAINALSVNQLGQVKKIVEQALATPAAPAAPVAGIDPTKTTTVGRAGREKQVTPQQMIEMLSRANVGEKQIILAATGFDLDVNPDTLAPMVVNRPDGPVAPADIARTLNVSRQAVSQALQKFGITADTVDQIAGDNPATYSDADLGLDTEGGLEAAGMRVEGTASKATGAGLVEGGSETAEQRRLRAEADEMLAAAPKQRTELALSAGQGTAADQARAEGMQVPEGATVTDLRDANPGQVEANIRAILSSALAERAALYWDHDAIGYDQLPDTLKANWVADFRDNERNNEGELDEADLAASEAAIGRDFYQLGAAVSVPETGPTQARLTFAGDTRADGGVRGLGRDTSAAQGADIKPSVARQSQATAADPKLVKKLQARMEKYEKLLVCLRKPG